MGGASGRVIEFRPVVLISVPPLTLTATWTVDDSP